MDKLTEEMLTMTPLDDIFTHLCRRFESEGNQFLYAYRTDNTSYVQDNAPVTIYDGVGDWTPLFGLIKTLEIEYVSMYQNAIDPDFIEDDED